MTGQIVCIAGTRGLDVEAAWPHLLQHVRGMARHHGATFSTFIHGGCLGSPDVLAPRLAKEFGVRCKAYPANWTKHGRGAGPIRNAEMAKVAHGLIAIWDGRSPGTRSAIEEFKRERRWMHVIDPRWWTTIPVWGSR